MKKMFMLISILSSIALMHAGSVRVSNNSGQHNVWGSIYYVFSGSAQRVGNPMQISGQSTFTLPAEGKSKAARYLVISRSQGLLEPIITKPFGAVGLKLIPIEAHSSEHSVVIERGQLPDEKV